MHLCGTVRRVTARKGWAVRERCAVRVSDFLLDCCLYRARVLGARVRVSRGHTEVPV